MKLQELAKVVAQARALPRRETIAPAGVRQRWASKLVIEVLRDADGPLTGRQIKRAAEAKVGEKLNKDTLRHALLFSRAARRGEIVRLDDGRYRTRPTANKRELGHGD